MFEVSYLTKLSGEQCFRIVARVEHSLTCPTAACYFNKDMMMHYHPGALLRNRWSCCQQHGKASLGCQPTYHLLTRSSSRYAQMRRKDTLSSSHSSERRSKSSSFQRGDKVGSNPPDTHVVPDDRATGSRGGQGRSNSCFDLTHKQVQNRFEPVVQDPESHRYSQLSTEPSVSMGCITLTRLSLTESSSPFLVPGDSVANTEVPERMPVKRVEGKKRQRFQVAPENAACLAPRTNFPSSESQPHLTYKSYPTAYPALPNCFTHSVSAQFCNGLQVPSSAITLTNFATSSQMPLKEGSYHCLTVPRKSRHSRTALEAINPSVRHSQLSCSLNVLPAKPVLEPKVSITDPNTIHV